MQKLHTLHVNQSIRPSITHGSFVWNHSLSTKRKKKILMVDSRILHNITRAFKSTPTHVLYTLTHICPTDFFILQSSVLSLYRLAASPRFVITNSLSYLVDHLQSLHLPNPGNIDLFPATTNIYRAYSVIINHDTPIETFNHTNLYFDIPPRTVNIFTDGSKIHNTTSAGYIIYSSVHNRSPFAGKVLLSGLNSVFQAEAAAIIQALSHHISSQLTPSTTPLSINIFSDSQSVLKSISKNEVRSQTIHSLTKLLHHLGGLHVINLIWVPGHRQIKGNEEADFLARNQLTSLTSYNNILVTSLNIPPPLTYIKKRLKVLEMIAIKNFITNCKSTNTLKTLQNVAQKVQKY